MGLFTVPVELEGPAGRERLDMLVDTGATYSVIPAALAQRLGLRETRTETIEGAGGARHVVPVVALQIRVDSREAASLAYVMPGRQILGAYALEGLGLGVDPSRKRLIPVEGFVGAVTATALVPVMDGATAVAPRQPADRHPAKVYLASLAPGSRRAMLQALNVCAEIISSGRHNAETPARHQLRFQHPGHPFRARRAVRAGRRQQDPLGAPQDAQGVPAARPRQRGDVPSRRRRPDGARFETARWPVAQPRRAGEPLPCLCSGSAAERPPGCRSTRGPVRRRAPAVGAHRPHARRV